MTVIRYEDAMRRLRGGEVVHVTFRCGVEYWWFDAPHADVDPEDVRLLRRQIVGCGDGLLEHSQSYRLKDGTR